MMLSIHQIKSSDLKLKHQYPTLMGPDKDYRQLLDSLFKQTIRIIFLLDVHFVLTQIRKPKLSCLRMRSVFRKIYG